MTADGRAKTPSLHTPGRKGRTGNQYFDVGKVGRKTGITLRDTGIRDEFGLEPMAGIFSSPVKEDVDAVVESSEATGMVESSGRDVDETLHLRKTPRLPPPRASTPKHTNIGSPKRMSSARPQSRAGEHASDVGPSRLSHAPTNRVIDFNTKGGVRMSIEEVSPFKPKRALRRSTGAIRQDPFVSNRLSFSPTRQDSSNDPELPDVRAGAIDKGDEDEDEDEDEVEEEEEEEAQDEREPSEQQKLDEQLMDDVPMFPNDDDDDDDDDDDYEAFPNSVNKSIETGLAQAQEVLASPLVNSAPRRKSARPRRSGDSINTSAVQHTPPVAQMTMRSSSTRKRGSEVLDDDDDEEEEADANVSQISTTSSKRPRGRPRKSDITILRDDTGHEETIDPALLAHGDSYLAPVDEDEPDHEPSREPYISSSAQPSPGPSTTTTTTTRRRPTAKKAPRPKPTQRAPRDRDPNTHLRPVSRDGDSASAPPRSPTKRASSVSNVNLRASTPFEDAHNHTSRSGRPILKPLKHWAGESYVWKNGEVQGIIRADEVKTPKKSGAGKKKKSRKAKGKRGKGFAGGNLSDLEEEAEEEDEEGEVDLSETDSLAPDAWESSLGVVAGTVASWDPVSQTGDATDTIREDIAFAATSILTREVAGSAFQYAKIQTLPFFGSGVVEVPPRGFKRAKNAQKMQMVFFVHAGKVAVTVGPRGNGGAGKQDEDEDEVNEFAISKGGVWVVPRGNNYSITNESRSRTARIFFAQGCEVEVSGDA